MLKTPPLQTATATIDTLCGRLHSATLLEDRRAAILGLRSFAKQFPASVASGSLRELIAILRRDGLGQQSSADDDKDGRQRQQEGTGDVDTIRLVLETFLMLFNPDSNSPEAGDEIAFFMADEFSMRQDNFALLLSLLDPTSPYADYYARLYSLQLLSAICLARPERLQECILSAPLGVSRLVGMLDDTRDAVRNAGLLLLVDLTSGASEDLRKIVAFEDVFVKAFALIRLEGGLAEAGITAQDCLTLLANLVAGSGSIQNMFRESGCVSLLTELLTQVFPASTTEASFIAQSREKSAFGLLQLLRFFFVSGESSTQLNQAAFFRAGAAQILIDVGFSSTLPGPIRITSLRCAADLIASNAPLQEAFAAMTVASSDPQDTSSTPTQHINGTRSSGQSAKNSTRPSVEKPRIYIIEALLDLTLDQQHAEPPLRNAACALIQAYMTGHDRIRAHFLQRAISGHAQNESAANVLSTVLEPDGDSRGLLFASWIIQDLIADNHDAKTALAAVKEGDENEGEDVLSFIQAIGSQLEDALKAMDNMAVPAYASLLIVFLWEYAGGVDDFLAESSSLLQALANVQKAATPDVLRNGLSATILGTIYEFSTKDSPIPRRSITPLLTQKLGRAKYLDALMEFRRSPAVKDFDLQGDDEASHLFSSTFIDLFTVEYARLRKAIDKDPGIEVLPPSAAEAGVDRDVLDDLRQQLQAAKDALAQAQSEGLAAGQKHEQDMLGAGKELQSVKAEVERLIRINQSMQQGHESELAELSTKHEQQRQGLLTNHQRALDDAKHSTNAQVQSAVQEREKAFAERAQDYERRLAELGNTHRAEQNGHGNTRKQLEAMTTRHNEIATREKQTGEQFAELNARFSRLDREHQSLQSSSSQSSNQLEQLRKELEQRQTETERLQSQLKELQDELRGREEELAAERAGFADLEKELEAAKSSAATAARSAGKSSDLESQLKEAKEAEKSAKEELESMLLVMGDIESKRDLYREKVKELGGEVSEDDEEEEEEEEEEDEDEVD